MVSSLDYHPFPSRFASKIHPFIFLLAPQGFISLPPEWLLNFVSNSDIPPCVGKTFKFMEFTFLENALIRGIFTHDFPHSKLAPKFLSSCHRQKEISHSPQAAFFRKSVSPNSRNGRRERTMICFMKIQSEYMKMTWSIRFLIFCMICNFSKCDGFTVLQIRSII